MKIYGIGTDIVAISRIQSIWDRFGDAFAKRILTPSELTEFSKFSKTVNPVPYLAKRFAAKEAFVKALGTGFRRQGLWLTDIGVKNNALGKPELDLTGSALHELKHNGIVETHLSLSDERDFAVAFVILMGSQ